jgi:hypothetical protein
MDFKKIRRVILLAYCTFFFAGCSDPQKQALNSFKPVVDHFSSQTNSDGPLYSDISYDVQKSDSLVSPFTGTIRFRKDEAIFTCHFALQDSKWVHKSIESDIDKNAEQLALNRIDADTNIINDTVRETIKAQYIQGTETLPAWEKRDIDNDLAKFLGCPKIMPENP